MEDKVLDTQCRAELKDKKRIVVKVGTSSLIHVETGELDLIKVEHREPSAWEARRPDLRRSRIQCP